MAAKDALGGAGGGGLALPPGTGLTSESWKVPGARRVIGRCSNRWGSSDQQIPAGTPQGAFSRGILYICGRPDTDAERIAITKSVTTNPIHIDILFRLCICNYK